MQLEMKGFVGVMDNDWLAMLSQQQGINEVNFLPKHSAIRTAGEGLDISWRSQPYQNL
jgi:hypothetical protein